MGEDTRRIIDGLKAPDRKALLALNKIDLIKREKLLELAAMYDAEGIFSDIFMISAETGDGVDDLVKALAARMPAGPWHFPADQISDVPLRLLAAEVTREHLFRQVHDELPYELTVENESWKDFEDGSVRIEQAIYIGRETQKPIVLGEGGRRIKSVRVAAQKELETDPRTQGAPVPAGEGEIRLGRRPRALPGDRSGVREVARTIRDKKFVIPGPERQRRFPGPMNTELVKLPHHRSVFMGPG